MVSEKMYDKLANLVVIKGVNVQKDQPVVIRANVRDAAFVRKIVLMSTRRWRRFRKYHSGSTTR